MALDVVQRARRMFRDKDCDTANTFASLLVADGHLPADLLPVVRELAGDYSPQAVVMALAAYRVQRSSVRPPTNPEAWFRRVVAVQQVRMFGRPRRGDNE